MEAAHRPFHIGFKKKPGKENNDVREKGLYAY